MNHALAREYDFAFSAESAPITGETKALLVLRGGEIIAERYADGIAADDTLPSWSMAKSVLHALVGILVGEGKLAIQEPAAVPQWRKDDPRAAITLDHLLRMSSGLAFREEYADAANSDVIPMLFGEGKDDVASFAAAYPLDHEPGVVWSYSSGTSNIISGIVARLFGNDRGAYERYLRTRLFDPIEMASADPRFDAAGTWIGSSFVFATARDFAKFGMLYLRDGKIGRDRLLPEGWVDYGTTLAPACTTGEYGAHWWLFSANGYDGQRILVAPEQDVVIVRLGKIDASMRPALHAMLLRVLDAAAE
jgi:CubicO group peptidase (beta-lactamase class C family)